MSELLPVCNCLAAAFLKSPAGIVSALADFRLFLNRLPCTDWTWKETTDHRGWYLIRA